MNKTKLISAKEVSEVVSWYTHACAGSMQGRRSTDEDATVILASLKNFESCRMCTIFDGHVGKDTALFCARNAANFIGNCKSLDVENITKACIQMDREILQSSFSNSGSTAIIAIIEKIYGSDMFKLYICNLGDSRAMLIKNDGSFISLSEDHKPYNVKERERIDKTGGFVANGRVLGYIGVSRSFGDKNYKKNLIAPENIHETMMTCVPDIRIYYGNAGDILFLGCDGVFEMLSWNDVAKFSYESVNKYALSDAVINILDYALLSGSKDNITIQIVKFFNDKKDIFYFREKIIPGIYIPNEHISKYEFYENFLNKYHIKNKCIINTLMANCSEVNQKYCYIGPYLKKIRENKSTHIILNRRYKKNIKNLTIPILHEDFIRSTVFNKMDQIGFYRMRDFFREYDKTQKMSSY
ncbi:protein phosphatase PPM3, putative [Plasmodium chabaudi chabaudi]|uniref:protein-serine/threonine phosphatase n=1 Tax=Plasmodium chabaudi chabaudi TaxID=31271 RepID=A0A077TNV7_PLACU|nr:protein phosphatase PPM3, putative [Plasmodium chabaudi chabaudi]SCM04353.1 protein phosphatase PPM3, putative [Plasmodium chabaudi chabaudi]SCM07627.1 protein phosphatase PPM3, putative [Plasmodium chabaudi chabaudi]VTZ70170.1 protein phosphatase PPM3, putative [Plasmodium chabaudi chabaudi]|eukprot:XP_016654518.1 protein phosphatase, putative [Plasmodium chabaudi chabaudi]